MRANIKTNSKDDILISACTITKNEEKNIERSIRSYKKFVDEIIIVDTGSTDKTVEIAEKLGATVIKFEWCGDFSKAKNAALDKAVGDWIIFLDADESFGGDCVKNLRKTLAYANEQSKNSIFCFMYNLDSNNDNKVIAVNKTLRIFKKGFRYRYPIHESLYCDDFEFLPMLVAENLLYINHTGYSKNIIKDKGQRNIDLILKSLEETDSPKRKAEYYFYLCDAYFSVNNYEKTSEYGLKFLDFCRENKKEIKDIERRVYTNVYNSNLLLKKNPADFYDLLKEFYRYCPDYVDAPYVLADVEMRMNLYSQSFEKAQSAVKMIDESKIALEGTMGAHRSSILNLMGKDKEGLLKDTEALDLYFEAMNGETPCADGAFNLIRLVKDYPEDKLNKFIEALYIGKSLSKKLEVIVALIKNYKFSQIFNCYAAIKCDQKDKSFDAQITAYLMMSKGLYKKASELFFVVYKINGIVGSARNGLICAIISKDSETLNTAKQKVPDTVLFALGFQKRKEKYTDAELDDIAQTYDELYRMGKNDEACSYIAKACQELSEKEILRITFLLMDLYAFETALFTVKLAPVSAQSLYFEGVCLYRLKRIFESADILALSKKMGCKEPAIDNLIEYINSLKSKLTSPFSGEKLKAAKKDIESKIENSDFAGAQADIETLFSACEPDDEIYALKAVLMFYCGLYSEAAIAVQCGLLKNEKSFDLLYNGGYIYDKLGDETTSKAMFKKALLYCSDSEVQKSIKSILGA